MLSPGVVFKLRNAQLYLDVTATKMFTDSTCQGWGTFLGVGQDFRSLNSDVRFPVLGFGTNTGRKECQHHGTSTTGLSLSDTEVID